MESFLRMVPNRFKAIRNEEDLIGAFSVFDKDGNGTIASGELRHLLTALGNPLDHEQVDSMMKEVIPGAAGYLDYAPFVHHVMNM